MLKRNFAIVLLSVSMVTTWICKTEVLEMLEEIKSSTVPPPALKQDYINNFVDHYVNHVTINTVKRKNPGNSRDAPPTPKELTEETDEITQRHGQYRQFWAV